MVAYLLPIPFFAAEVKSMTGPDTSPPFSFMRLAADRVRGGENTKDDMCLASLAGVLETWWSCISVGGEKLY